MKAAESKVVASPTQKKSPFFSKGGEQDFFGSLSSEGSFFSKTPHKSSSIQTKLTIGQPDDKYEREADAMADKVVQRLADTRSEATVRNGDTLQTKPIVPLTSITPFVQTKCASCEQEEKLQKKEEVEEKDLLNDKVQKKPIFETNGEPPEDLNNIQRKCAECEKEEKIQKQADTSDSQMASPHIERNLSSSKGGGSPIPSTTRRQMESSFGADFSSVRLHNDSMAAQMNKDLNAQAFTNGNDIYFNSGKYNTTSKGGQHLLAHELTHAIQQSTDLLKYDSNVMPFSSASGQRLLKKWTNPVVSFKSNEELIDSALNEKDTSALKQVTDFSSIRTLDDKLKLIDLLNGETSVWGRDARAMRLLWVSIGPDFDVVSGQDSGARWKISFSKVPDLIDEVPAAKRLKEEFQKDVKKLAKSYLKKNEATVLQEMSRLGLPENETKNAQPANKEQADAFKNVQEMASAVAGLQKGREALSQIVVGRRKASSSNEEDQMYCDIQKLYKGNEIDEDDRREYQNSKKTYDEYGDGDTQAPVLKHTCKLPATFDSNKQPDYPLSQGEKGQSWDSVNKVHLKLSNDIAQIANQSPAVYALIGQGGKNSASEVANASLEEGRIIIAKAMREVLKNIRETGPKLDTDDLDYRDLTPLHAQLFAGLKVDDGSKIVWSNEVPQSIAKYIVKDHEITQALIKLSLQTVAALAFLVAEIATMGTATFFIAAAVAAGTAGADLAISAENYEDLAKAAKTNVSDESKIISKGQVDAAEMEVALAAVTAILIAAGLSTKAIATIQSIRRSWQLRKVLGGNKLTTRTVELFHYGDLEGVDSFKSTKGYPRLTDCSIATSRSEAALYTGTPARGKVRYKYRLTIDGEYFDKNFSNVGTRKGFSEFSSKEAIPVDKFENVGALKPE